MPFPEASPGAKGRSSGGSALVAMATKKSITETLAVPLRTNPPELQSQSSSRLRVTCTRNHKGACGPGSKLHSTKLPGGVLCKHAG